MERYNPTERSGVIAIESIVVNSLGWIFREQPIVDVGVDAHIEHVANGLPSGKLIAMQIKTGASHFTDKGDALIYYPKNVHLEYWNGHSLPVVLVAHLPNSNETFWVHLASHSITPTKSKWKIEVPKSNVFGTECLESLTAIFQAKYPQNDPYYLSKINWTPYHRVEINDFVPPTANSIKIQYRLWSTQSFVPLLIRIASEKGEGIMEEHAGPSGVIDIMLTNHNCIYISIAHPEANFQLSILGWSDNI